MAKTDSTGSTWRYRWAHRQNVRRVSTFRGAETAWRRRDDELRRLRALAADFQGSAAAGAGLPLELAGDEVVLWALPAAQLVEVRHTPVLPAPDLAVAPPSGPLRPRRPDGVRVTDAGMAVITSRRLVLLGGRGRRDWAYGRMTGLSHDPAAPVTLIQVLDRRRTSGLMLPTDAAADFRFKLTLAFADAIEQRPAVLAQLDELIAEHAQLKPFRPAAATPAQARLSARVPGGRRTVAVAAAVALLVPAALVESDPSDPTGGAEVAVAATPAPSPSPGVAPVLVRPAVSAPAPRTSPKPTKAPRPSPTASRDPRCGAPDNPLGYDFCGGTRIRRPATEVCDWFDCTPEFWAGRGYLVQCRDGSVSLTGGRSNACAEHRGVRRTFGK
ncbi:hypothetical protein DKT68_23105 [Micromonospora acroterricola]|uniref:Uncharacterized protein n=1 Tax=Micromonospora acroterricola TaxID=2202421 RepID=A0A317D0Y6_9ACTN|nr:hypothetical protein [Micromonospora acroterricola]PWR06235.1 hypothetical protein DKT68_23105 [Micromonospora acroterricola]